MGIKAVLFDADGLFIHREKYFSELLQEEFNIPLEKTMPFFTGIFQKCLVGKADLREEVQKYFISWKWDRSVDDLLHIWFSHESTIDMKMVDYVQDLKKRGVKVLMGTNNEKYRTDFIIQDLELGKIFDKVYGSGYVGYVKPYEEFFQYILDEQKLMPPNIVFWDDDTLNVEGARKMGLHAEFFTSFIDMSKKMENYLSS